MIDSTYKEEKIKLKKLNIQHDKKYSSEKNRKQTIEKLQQLINQNIRKTDIAINISYEKY